MKWILLLSSLVFTVSTSAKEISISGDSSVKTSTENLLSAEDKITIKDENGRVVAYKLGKVEKGSPLAKRGLKSGDILSMPNSEKKTAKVEQPKDQ